MRTESNANGSLGGGGGAGLTVSTGIVVTLASSTFVLATGLFAAGFAVVFLGGAVVFFFACASTP